MTYPAYEKYNDSGVDWLGDIPEEWEVTRLNEAAKIKTSNVDKKTHEGEEPVRLCNYIDVYYNAKITSKIKFMSASATFAEISKFKLYKGDVVLTKDSESASDIGIPTLIDEEIDDLVCGYHLSILKPIAKKSDGSYLYYAIKSQPSAAQFEVSANGVTRFGLSLNDLKILQFALPLLPEQKAIAEFLDRKTAQIDVLIDKKEQLLKLLAEQRTALITHAVTKGLNPNAQMKESDIDWLGDIPQGWEVRKLSQAIKYIVGFTPDSGNPIYYGEGYDWINISDLGAKYITSAAKQITQEAIDKFKKRPAPKGSLLYSFKLTVGSVSIAGKEIYTNEAIAAFLEGGLLDIGYLYYLAPLAIVQNASENIYGAKILNQDLIDGAKLVVPPLREQKMIAEFLDRKSAQIDAIKSKTKEIITHLKEYRTAIITSAVTGKIKVV